jgi:hypothetical protein
MQPARKKENRDASCGMRSSGNFPAQERMHPEDYKAHLAWVISKQFRELALKKTLNEKPVVVSAHFMG